MSFATLVANIDVPQQTAAVLATDDEIVAFGEMHFPRVESLILRRGDQSCRPTSSNHAAKYRSVLSLTSGGDFGMVTMSSNTRLAAAD